MICSVALAIMYSSSHFNSYSVSDRQLSRGSLRHLCFKIGKKRVKHDSIYFDGIYDTVHHDGSNPIAKKTKVLMGIFSASGMEKYDHCREYIRETSVNPDEKHLSSLQDYMYRVDNDEKGDEIDCEIIYTFVIGGANDFERPEDHSDDKPLTLAQDRHGNSEPDCTYLNIRENMEEGKSATWFKYASLLVSNMVLIM